MARPVFSAAEPVDLLGALERSIQAAKAENARRRAEESEEMSKGLTLLCRRDVMPAAVSPFDRAIAEERRQADALARVFQLLQTHPGIDAVEALNLTRCLAPLDRRLKGAR